MFVWNFAKMLWWLSSLLVTFACINGQTIQPISEEQMQLFLNNYNSESIELCRQVQQASWDVATDVDNAAKVDAKVR